MKSEVKKLWVEALESGAYTQTTGGLKGNDNSFCCLGVLCDLYAKSTGDGKWDDQVFTCHRMGGSSYRETSYLPGPVQVWAGLEEDNPCAGTHILSKMNDDGYSFLSIARMIDKDL